jgi:hypothetical protein
MKYFTLILGLFLYGLSFGQLPDYRQTEWSNSGANVSFSKDTLFFNQFFTNGISADEAMINALGAASAKKGVLVLDKGVFEFKKTIQIPNDVALIGQGSANTQLVFNLNGEGNSIEILGNSENEKYNLLEDAKKGETAVIIASSEVFKEGDWIKIGENNNQLITSEWAKNSAHQIVQIRKIQGNTLMLKDPLRLNITLNKQAYVSLLKPKNNIALSGFYLKRKDRTNAQTASIFMRNAVHVSIKNIQSDSCNFAHIQIEESANITVHGCYIQSAFDYGEGGKAYGIALQFGASNCLIENNIFSNLRHSVLLQAGANGNVIGYNYSRAPYWTGTQFPAGLAGDLVLHGNAPFLNLFEGNICQNIVIDDSHGINGEHNTFFRNRAEYYGLFMNNAPASDSQNFIGNEITGIGTIKAGLFSLPMGNFSLSGQNHYQQYNLLPNAIRPTGSSSIQLSSMYLNEKPAWWNSSQPFPFCGEKATFNQNYNQAYLRYFYNANKTADAEKDSLELKIIVAQQKDYLAVNWSTIATKPTTSFELFWKDENQNDVEMYSLQTKGETVLTNNYYFFHDYRKNLSGMQSYLVQQNFADGSSIKSNWVSISLPLIAQTPSTLFYPNPASEQIMFNQTGNIKIFNASGALVHQLSAESPSILNIAHWPRGVYFVVTNTNSNILKERLIKN